MRPQNTTVVAVVIVLLAAVGGAMFGGCYPTTPEWREKLDAGIWNSLPVEEIAVINSSASQRVWRLCDPEAGVLCYFYSYDSISCVPLSQTAFTECPVEEPP